MIEHGQSTAVPISIDWKRASHSESDEYKKEDGFESAGSGQSEQLAQEKRRSATCEQKGIHFSLIILSPVVLIKEIDFMRTSLSNGKPDHYDTIGSCFLAS